MAVEPDSIPDSKAFAAASYVITYGQFMAASWTTASIALIFVAVRLYARFRGPRKLFADDILVIFAYSILLATACLWQWAARDMYTLLDAQARRITQLPDDWMQDLPRFMNVWGACQILYYTCLTLVKLSVLFFFRRLGYQVDKIHKVWWVLIVYVAAAWIITIACTPWKCFSSTDNAVEFVMSCNDPSYQTFVTNSYKVNTALDVSSDFFITLLPVLLIWDLRMPLKKKAAFVGLFSLTVFVMITAIVRIVGAGQTQDRQLDPSYLFLWSAIEMCIAIIIACLSAFPQLFVSSRSCKPAYQPSQTFIERIRAKAFMSKQTNHPQSRDSLMITEEIGTMTIHPGDDFGYVSVPESSKSMASIPQAGYFGVPPDAGMRPQSPHQGIMLTREYRIHHDQITGGHL